MSHETKESQPLFSRCSLGKSRWFWVLYRSFVDKEPAATGYAPTAEDAENAARATAPDAENIGNGTAAHYHRRLCVKRRAAKPAGASKEATAQEFLFSYGDGDFNGTTSIPHLIVKKTKKRVFVEKNRYRPDPWDRETYALDRAKLEAEGRVWSRAARHFFYTTPYEERQPRWVPPELAVLGLKGNASKDEIKTAYRRLARQHHPDCSGDPEKFKELQAAYERAMAG